MCEGVEPSLRYDTKCRVLLIAKSYLYEIQRRIVGIHLVLAFVILPPRWRWWDVEEEPIPNRAVSR